LEEIVRIENLKANKKSSRAKSHTTGGGKKRAHNVGGKLFRRKAMRG
jgi:hypothetical protein